MTPTELKQKKERGENMNDTARTIEWNEVDVEAFEPVYKQLRAAWDEDIRAEQ